MPAPVDQKVLAEFLARRHPFYEEALPRWNFMQQTYDGGREWFADNIHKYRKEGEDEFKDRVARAYRFPHTREIVDLIQKYIFKSPVCRSDDAPDEVKAFWKDTTLSGLSIDQFMRLVAALSSIMGVCWVFTDSTKNDEVVSRSDEKKVKARAYAYIMNAMDVLDASFDDNGDLEWVKTVERVRDDKDPFTSSGEITERFRLWTRTEWFVFEEREVGKKKNKVIVIVDEGVNPLGVVPAFPVLHVLGEQRYVAPGLIDDIAYLDKAAANYLSNLDAIIQDQTFSQLAMPAQNLMPGEESYDKMLEMGTKRIFLYDGEGGGKPEYISPDVKQAQLIVTVINKIINEIYHTVGMAGERTKQDNAVGVDNSSGVAKAYDFERLNSLLTTKSQSLENCENKLIHFISLWNGKKRNDDEVLVKYADTFDVRSLFDEFTVAERLLLVDAPKEVRQEQMKQVVDKLFPALAKDIKAKIIAGLKTWPVDPVERAGELAKVAAAARPEPKVSGGKPASTNPQTAKRQGQVTAATK